MGHSSHAPVFEPDLDAVRVNRGIGQDILDDTPRHFSALLVFLENDINNAAGAYGVTTRFRSVAGHIVYPWESAPRFNGFMFFHK
jgi:hypothetical protein